MPLLAKINQVIALYLDCFRKFFAWRIWLTLMLYYGAFALLLLALSNVATPVLYGPVTTWVGIISGILSVFGRTVSADQFVHYPMHLLMLPELFGWSKLLIGLLLESIVLSSAALLFGSYFLGGHADNKSGSLLSRWPTLAGLWLICNLLYVVAGFLLPELMAPLLTGFSRRQLLFDFLFLPFIYMLILMPFYFALPAAAVLGDSFGQAISRSIRIFLRRPFTAFFLSFMVLIGPAVVSGIVNRAPTILQQYRPELIYYFLLVGLLVEMTASFFWMGTAVRFLSDEEE